MAYGTPELTWFELNSGQHTTDGLMRKEQKAQVVPALDARYQVVLLD